MRNTEFVKLDMALCMTMTIFELSKKISAGNYIQHDWLMKQAIAQSFSFWCYVQMIRTLPKNNQRMSHAESDAQYLKEKKKRKKKKRLHFRSEDQADDLKDESFVLIQF